MSNSNYKENTYITVCVYNFISLRNTVENSAQQYKPGELLNVIKFIVDSKSE